MRGFLTVVVVGSLAFGISCLAASLGPVRTAAAQEDLAPDAGRARGRDRTGRPTAALVAERLRSLSGQARADELAGDALDHARRALHRSRELAHGGRLDAAERARQIAWAALSLASRQIARARAREALAHARRRLAAADARASRSREALEHAMRQRARALERRLAPPPPIADDQDDPEERE